MKRILGAGLVSILILSGCGSDGSSNSSSKKVVTEQTTNGNGASSNSHQEGNQTQEDCNNSVDVNSTPLSI